MRNIARRRSSENVRYHLQPLACTQQQARLHSDQVTDSLQGGSLRFTNSAISSHSRDELYQFLLFQGS